MRYLLIFFLMLPFTLFGQRDFRRLEKYYQKEEYYKVLDEFKRVQEKTGAIYTYKGKGKYGKSAKFYSYPFLAKFRILLSEPSKENLVFELMHEYVYLSRIDIGKQVINSDSTFTSFHDYIKTYSEKAFNKKKIHEAVTTADFLVKYFSDTVSYYELIYRPHKEVRNHLDYATVDEFARQEVPFKIQSIEQLAKYLTSGLPNDTLKLRALFTWVHEQIHYAPHASNKITDMLRSRLGDCDGKSLLFNALAEAIGMQTKLICGHVKTIGNPNFSGPTTHCWSMVKMPTTGKWELFEVTWIDLRDFNRYFLIDPYDHIRTHYPENLAYQLLDPPISQKDFLLGKFPNKPSYTLQIK